MKLLYTHENKIIVENVRNTLRDAGIEPEMRSEFSSSGVGELSPIETWPELWVDDCEYVRAKDVVDRVINAPLGQKWSCANCGEENESTFEICWNCQCGNS